MVEPEPRYEAGWYSPQGVFSLDSMVEEDSYCPQAQFNHAFQAENLRTIAVFLNHGIQTENSLGRIPTCFIPRLSSTMQSMVELSLRYEAGCNGSFQSENS